MGTVKISYDKSAKDLMNFIKQVKEGVYTKGKPIITDISFLRMEIQEQNESFDNEIQEEENLLFGITY